MGPRHGDTVGSEGGAVSYERGTSVGDASTTPRGGPPCLEAGPAAFIRELS